MPTRLKQILMILGGLLYVVWPVDLAPDMMPGLGWIDDLIVVGLLLWYLSGIRGGTPGGGFRGETGEQKGETQSPRQPQGVHRGLPLQPLIGKSCHNL